MNYIRLPDDLKAHQVLMILVAWSLIAVGLGAYVGVSCSEVDCGTCEASLDKAIDELHACQQELLTRPISQCEDERQAERQKCEQTLSQYKTLRCRICEASHDTYPPEPVDNLNTSPSLK